MEYIIKIVHTLFHIHTQNTPGLFIWIPPKELIKIRIISRPIEQPRLTVHLLIHLFLPSLPARVSFTEVTAMPPM